MLLRPRWLAGHVLVVVLVCAFVAAGFWQLHRNTEKHDKVIAARAAYAAPAPPLTGTPAPAAGTRAEVTGVYDSAHEVLLRDQIRGSQAGEDVLTPLRLSDGTAVLVDRGWLGGAGAEAAPQAPTGSVTVRGIVQASRPNSDQRSARTVGTRLSVPSVDVNQVSEHVGFPLRPAWIQAQAQAPVPGPGQPLLPQPPAPDQVNHMEYAIQRFAFALIPLIGWPIVLWRRGRKQPVA